MNDRQRADDVYAELLTRQGERWVEPRIDRTRRVLELLDDPQKTYRVIHITGTNGKTSTARMIESLLRAHGLRTGLFTSPHLVRFTERVLIDGTPIEDAKIAHAWEEIEAVVAMVDAELVARDEARLTFFELLTVLAFVAFADAPVDVLVLEVGMGGEWDSTNTADGDVAVFTPIGIDHADRLGNTVEEIATVKAGIIKEGARVVSAAQEPGVTEILRARAIERHADVAVQGAEFDVDNIRVAVGGQLIDIRGLAAEYREEYVPLHGAHQAQNASVAVAAVEAFLGDGQRAIPGDILAEGLGAATSPGRLQLIGTAPTVLTDAAHNPHGARALAAALPASFDVDEWGIVLGVLGDKDAAGIIHELAPVAQHVFVTAPDSERAGDVDVLADIAERQGLFVTVHPELSDAARAARDWASEGEKRAVIITGSIVLAGEAIHLAAEEEWKATGEEQR